MDRRGFLASLRLGVTGAIIAPTLAETLTLTSICTLAPSC